MKTIFIIFVVVAFAVVSQVSASGLVYERIDHPGWSPLKQSKSGKNITGDTITGFIQPDTNGNMDFANIGSTGIAGSKVVGNEVPSTGNVVPSAGNVVPSVGNVVPSKGNTEQSKKFIRQESLQKSTQNPVAIRENSPVKVATDSTNLGVKEDDVTNGNSNNSETEDSSPTIKPLYEYLDNGEIPPIAAIGEFHLISDLIVKGFTLEKLEKANNRLTKLFDGFPTLNPLKDGFGLQLSVIRFLITALKVEHEDFMNGKVQ